METLPVEMVEEITQYLTPKDLAQCCGVSRAWHGIFNKDWLWRLHCDPEMEEPLRTTPCVVEPIFVTPQVEGSSLTPISNWRLAYMREQHLWKNWKHMNCKKQETKKIVELQFLTDTLVVEWLLDCVEIWDVSVIPAKLIMKRDIEGKLGSMTILDQTEGTESQGTYVAWDSEVIDRHTLLVANKNYFAVLEVDFENKRIKLKNGMTLDADDSRPHAFFTQKPSGDRTGFANRVVKEKKLLFRDNTRSGLIICDLETGKIIKEEPCSIVTENHGDFEIFGMARFSFSDDILVCIIDHIGEVYMYVYRLQQLQFLQSPVIKANQMHFRNYDLALNGNYFACGHKESFKISNYLTSEVVFEIPEKNVLTSRNLRTLNEYIIFLESDGRLLKVFSVLDKTVITLCRNEEKLSFDVFKKFLIVFTSNKIYGIWENRSGNLSKLEQSEYKFDALCSYKYRKMNAGFTNWTNRFGNRSELEQSESKFDVLGSYKFREINQGFTKAIMHTWSNHAYYHFW